MTILEIKQYFEQVFQIIKKVGTVEEQQKAIALNEQLGQYRTEKMRNKGKCGKIWAWISK